MVLLTVLGSLTFTACGGDDPDPVNPEVTLSVTPTDISLMATQGASASFTVSATHAWVISCDADWINLSSKSGNGSTTITVTALGDNKSSAERSTAITITSGDKTQTVNVKQLPLYNNTYVDISEVFTLYNSVSFKLEFYNDVSYFYTDIWSEQELLGKTDEDIANLLSTDHQAFKPDTEAPFTGVDGLSANTKYYVCVLAFNDKNERGVLTKKEFKTLAITARCPTANIAITYTSTKWKATVSKGVYTDKYSVAFWTGLEAYVYYVRLPYAYIAYIIKKAVEDGSEPLISRESVPIEEDMDSAFPYFYVTALAKDSNGNWSYQLNSNFRTTSSNTVLKSMACSPADTKSLQFFGEVKGLKVYSY